MDFGDAHYSFRIFDLANAILYLLLDVINEPTTNLINELIDLKVENLLKEISQNFLNEYLKQRQISLNEIKHIGLCIKSRLLITLIYGLRTKRLNYR